MSLSFRGWQRNWELGNLTKCLQCLYKGTWLSLKTAWQIISHGVVWKQCNTEIRMGEECGFCITIGEDFIVRKSIWGCFSMLLRRVSISWLVAQTRGSQLKCCQEFACCVGKLHMTHRQCMSPCSEQKTSLGAAVVCTGGQAVMEETALATSATLDLITGWSASASIKYWRT